MGQLEGKKVEQGFTFSRGIGRNILYVWKMNKKYHFFYRNIDNNSSLRSLYVDHKNTPGTRVGPGGGDRTLAVKRRKNDQNSIFFL